MKIKALFAIFGAAFLVACNVQNQFENRVAITADSTAEQRFAYMIGAQMALNDFSMVPHQMGKHLDEDCVMQGIRDDLKKHEDEDFEYQISGDSLRSATFNMESLARGRYGQTYPDSATLVQLGDDRERIQKYKDSVLASLPVEPEGKVTGLPVKLSDTTATKMQMFSYRVGIQYASVFLKLRADTKLDLDVEYFVLGVRESSAKARDTTFAMQMSNDSITVIRTRFDSLLAVRQQEERERQIQEEERMKAEAASLRGDTLDNGMPAKINFNVKVKGITLKTENLLPFAGKPMLLTYFSATCGHCAHTAPQIVEIFKEFASRGLVSTTVFSSSNSKSGIRKFMDKAQFDERMNVVFDETRVFGELYSDGYVPKIYIVNPDGSYKLYVSLDNKIDAIKSEIAALLDGKNVEP